MRRIHLSIRDSFRVVTHRRSETFRMYFTDCFTMQRKLTARNHLSRHTDSATWRGRVSIPPLLVTQWGNLPTQPLPEHSQSFLKSGRATVDFRFVLPYELLMILSVVISGVLC